MSIELKNGSINTQWFVECQTFYFIIDAKYFFQRKLNGYKFPVNSTKIKQSGIRGPLLSVVQQKMDTCVCRMNKPKNN